MSFFTGFLFLFTWLCCFSRSAVTAPIGPESFVAHKYFKLILINLTLLLKSRELKSKAYLGLHCAGNGLLCNPSSLPENHSLCCSQWVDHTYLTLSLSNSGCLLFPFFCCGLHKIRDINIIALMLGIIVSTEISVLLALHENGRGTTKTVIMNEGWWMTQYYGDTFKC